MKQLRKVISWLHLAVGTGFGLVLAVMAASGITLAFRDQLTAVAERAVRTVPVPAPAMAKGLRELMPAVRAARPGGHPQLVVLERDPAAAVQVVVGHDDVVFVNPYTAQVRPSDCPRVRAFFSTVEGLHRWLGLAGAGRKVGQAVTGAACAGMFFLALSGPYIWWPRRATAAVLRARLRPRVALRGGARDRHWHEVTGLWLTPVLLLSTATGLVTAYPALGDLLPRRPAPVAAAAPPTAAVPDRPPGIEGQLTKVEAAYPRWETITVWMGGGQRDPGMRSGPSFLIRESGTWPRWTLQAAVDPASGRVVARDDPAGWPFLERFRHAAKELHTGSAGGAAGEAAGALGILLLVATGLSLALRRLARARRRQPAA